MIAISATQSSLDAPLEERFENSSCLVIADAEGAVKVPLRFSRRMRGSKTGVQISPMLVERGVSVVLTGRCDPNSLEHLASAGLHVVTGCSGTVRQVLERFTSELNGPLTFDAGFSPVDAETGVYLDQYLRTGVGGGGKGRHRMLRRVTGGFGRGGGGGWHLDGIGGI